jgi:hypothetical protein
VVSNGVSTQFGKINIGSTGDLDISQRQKARLGSSDNTPAKAVSAILKMKNVVRAVGK